MRRKPLASVQQHIVRAREVFGDVLCLHAPLSPTKRAYRAVLEVSLLNFQLKPGSEQDALVERYHTLLKTLTFPLQILVRNQRQDIEAYLAEIRAHIPERGPQDDETWAWPELAAEEEERLRSIKQHHLLLERHCYLIIPAPDLLPTGWKRKKRRSIHLNQALNELTIRVETLKSQLAALGLRPRRLKGEELAQLYHQCLTPDRALKHPLTSHHFGAVGHLLHHTLHETAWQEDDQTPLEPGEEPDENDVPFSVVRPRRSRQTSFQTQSRPLPPPDLLRLADLLAPGSMEEFPDAVRIGDEWVRGLAVTALPRDITSSLLAPLLTQNELFDLSMHIQPQDQRLSIRQLRRRRMALNATQSLQQTRGRDQDPTVNVAHNDLNKTINKLASGEERMLEVSLYLLVRAPNKEQLNECSERLIARLNTMLLDPVTHPTTFEQVPALQSALPQASDTLGRSMTFDALTVAYLFLFMSNELDHPKGPILGTTEQGGVVRLDPWYSLLENPHISISGETGAGKSQLEKTWALAEKMRDGIQGEQIWAMDPDGERVKWAKAIGGSIVRLAPGSEHHLNPFDLVPTGCDLPTYLHAVVKKDRLAEKLLDLHALLDILLGERGSTLTQREKALLDRALTETYRRVGIGRDPRTHFHPPPLLRDLAEVLGSGVCGADETDLVLRLSRYTDGSLSSFFAGQTNVQLDGHLLEWDLTEMVNDLRPLGIFLIADCLWTQATYQSHRSRCLVIDEAATLLDYEEGARFLANLAQRGRKRFVRLVVIIQSLEAFCKNPYGSAVIANCAIKIFKKHELSSLQELAPRFGLSAQEIQRISSFSPAETLLIAGDRRVIFTTHVGPRAYDLMTTNPVELAAMAQDSTISKRQEVLV